MPVIDLPYTGMDAIRPAHQLNHLACALCLMQQKPRIAYLGAAGLSADCKLRFASAAAVTAACRVSSDSLASPGCHRLLDICMNSHRVAHLGSAGLATDCKLRFAFPAAVMTAWRVSSNVLGTLGCHRLLGICIDSHRVAHLGTAGLSAACKLCLASAAAVTAACRVSSDGLGTLGCHRLLSACSSGACCCPGCPSALICTHTVHAQQDAAALADRKSMELVLSVESASCPSALICTHTVHAQQDAATGRPDTTETVLAASIADPHHCSQQFHGYGSPDEMRPRTRPTVAERSDRSDMPHLQACLHVEMACLLMLILILCMTLDGCVLYPPEPRPRTLLHWQHIQNLALQRVRSVLLHHL